MAAGTRIELLLPALPEHVRTARLVVVTVARRAGLHDGLVDEIRQAVGEACGRAVAINAVRAPHERIALEMIEDVSGLSVTVTDVGPSAESTGDLDADDLDADDFTGDGASPEVALAVLEGLVDEFEVSVGTGGGTVVRMTWPLAAGEAARPASTAAADS